MLCVVYVRFLIVALCLFSFMVSLCVYVYCVGVCLWLCLFICVCVVCCRCVCVVVFVLWCICLNIYCLCCLVYCSCFRCRYECYYVSFCIVVGTFLCVYLDIIYKHIEIDMLFCVVYAFMYWCWFTNLFCGKGIRGV